MSKYPAPHEGLEEADWGFSSSGMRLSVGVVHNAASDGVEANAWASEEGWNTATALTSKAESESLSVQSAVQAPGYDFGVGDDEDDGSGSQHSVSVAEAPSSSPLEVTKEREQRQPVITKSHQLNHITSIFNDSQKIAYVGLCYLIITSMRARYQRNVDLSAQSYSKTPNVKSTLAAFSAWSEHFMNMLYAFVDVSNEEQTMIVNLATHGLMPTDLSKGLIDDAQRALERLQKMQAEEAWIKQQEAKWIDSYSTSITSSTPGTCTKGPPQTTPPIPCADITDIRYTILSHLFILCICDGLYDTRSRTLLRAVANELQISWWDLARLEDTIAEQLRRQESEGGDVGAGGPGGDVKPEEKTVRERNAKDSKGRWLYMGLATLGAWSISSVCLLLGLSGTQWSFHGSK
ncbi:hypothetical protein BC830DRAFT_616322 [Chytriomyces sp. MP71]|nr:hypothetical protein BC830DRAFT_616322 [Chytriomyces sp. MP71]